VIQASPPGKTESSCLRKARKAAFGAMQYTRCKLRGRTKPNVPKKSDNREAYEGADIEERQRGGTQEVLQSTR
jgi:hypothetical protein